jgi:hypothetical protein
MDTAVMLQTFFDPDWNLRGKSIVCRVDRRTDDCGKAGIDEHLTAGHNKDPLLSGVSGCGVSDKIELATLHGIT